MMNRSQMMAAVRSKDTKPEMFVRRLVHAMGYRYRLRRPDLPGKPDLVFPARRRIIFIHGCFWHQHGKAVCRDSGIPKTRQEYWIPKLDGNRKRDRRTVQLLKKQGWDVLVVWECETRNAELMKKRLMQFLSKETAKE
jgi:DNA mismatch endonuclease (patch repair protein)